MTRSWASETRRPFPSVMVDFDPVVAHDGGVPVDGDLNTIGAVSIGHPEVPGPDGRDGDEGKKDQEEGDESVHRVQVLGGLIKSFFEFFNLSIILCI